MNKRDIFIFLFPCLLFFTFVGGGFFLSNQIAQKLNPAEMQKSKDLIDAFVKNVESGKWKLTTEKAIQIIKGGQELNESRNKTIIAINDILFTSAWLGVVAFLLQLGAILSFNSKLRKTRGRLEFRADSDRLPPA